MEGELYVNSVGDPLRDCDPGKNKLRSIIIAGWETFVGYTLGTYYYSGYRDPGASAQRIKQLSIRGTVDQPPNLSLGGFTQPIHCPEGVVLGFQLIE